MPSTAAKIKWDAAGEHLFETGVKNGVLTTRVMLGMV